MLFGQSVFQSVLDRLKAEDDEAAEQDAPTARVSGLNTGLAFDVMEGVSAQSNRADQAYVETMGFAPETAPESSPVPPTSPEPDPVMPDHLTRVAPEDIAAELDISMRDTAQGLSEKRRAFAKKNHPDRVHPLFRENATKRMTTANLLIDQALRRLGR
ncbi:MULTISPECIES: hypothetical protein [unclassified Rhizobium]|uniref:hypothetical protein n=1 Tax=unclassified Rhizobium TaxID=2613769 RepID=UPI001610B983|nr:MULTISPECIES: hypothetical protein [unclassified Rhizobium]MBB3541066.1 hypothetical protein [Rhizobium sp. BK399]MCS3743821.1 hypothetical protein [Rhizobium sp. BK661]MCS4093730.1 hypothetical protein [Rhizobium sp. BK176]